MLRASSQTHDEAVELDAIVDGSVGSGIPNGEYLVGFAEAVVSRDLLAITAARDALTQAAGAEAMVDAAGVISNFQRMVRIADSTGIGLGGFEAVTEDIRESLGLEAFRHHD
jgi:hypothetical protein